MLTISARSVEKTMELSYDYTGYDYWRDNNKNRTAAVAFVFECAHPDSKPIARNVGIISDKNPGSRNGRNHFKLSASSRKYPSVTVSKNETYHSCRHANLKGSMRYLPESRLADIVSDVSRRKNLWAKNIYTGDYTVKCEIIDENTLGTVYAPIDVEEMGGWSGPQYVSRRVIYWTYRYAYLFLFGSCSIDEYYYAGSPKTDLWISATLPHTNIYWLNSKYEPCIIDAENYSGDYEQWSSFRRPANLDAIFACCEQEKNRVIEYCKAQHYFYRIPGTGTTSAPQTSLGWTFDESVLNDTLQSMRSHVSGLYSSEALPLELESAARKAQITDDYLMAKVLQNTADEKGFGG